ncbi:MAG: GDP-mannose 4,6-dehydratase, partial [Phycisphaerales bacterium]
MNLVTGGAGFIGSHLVQQLVERGEGVRVLERP